MEASSSLPILVAPRYAPRPQARSNPPELGEPLTCLVKNNYPERVRVPVRGVICRRSPTKQTTLLLASASLIILRGTPPNISDLTNDLHPTYSDP